MKDNDLQNNTNCSLIRLDVDNNWSIDEFAKLMNGLSDLYNLSFSIYKSAELNAELSTCGLFKGITTSEIYENIDAYLSKGDYLKLESASMNSPGYFNISGIAQAICELRKILETIFDRYDSFRPVAINTLETIKVLNEMLEHTDNIENIKIITQRIFDFNIILQNNNHVKVNKN